MLHLNGHPQCSESPTLRSEWRRASQTPKAIIIIINIIIITTILQSKTVGHKRNRIEVDKGENEVIMQTFAVVWKRAVWRERAGRWRSCE